MRVLVMPHCLGVVYPVSTCVKIPEIVTQNALEFLTERLLLSERPSVVRGNRLNRWATASRSEAAIDWLDTWNLAALETTKAVNHSLFP